MPSLKTTTIGTLRVRGAEENSLSLRQSFSTMLSSADLTPMGIPPSAILIVNKMEDPLPRRLTQGAIWINQEWELAAKSYLTRMYHQAVRPMQGIIPSNESAVLFTDEGEMLACLMLDMSLRDAGRHWWWKTVLRPIHYQEGLKSLLYIKAIYLPSAIHYLVEWGQAGSVVNSLSPEEIMAAISFMSREYGIDNLEKVVHEAFSEEFERDDSESSKKSGIYIRDEKEVWKNQLSNELKHIKKEKRFFIELGLALYYNPSQVRIKSKSSLTRFVNNFTTNWDYSLEEKNRSKLIKPGHEKEKNSIPSTGLSVALVQERASKKENMNENISPNARLLSQYKSTTFESKSQNNKSFLDIKKPSFFDESAETTEVTSIENHEKDSKALFSRKPAKIEVPSEIEGIKKDFLSDPQPVNPLQKMQLITEFEEHAEEDQRKLKLEYGVDTELGGILYLINLMKKLDLPECFEEEFGLASSLGTWGVLVVITRALMGNKYEHFAADPLWEALIELSSLDTGKFPGEDFQGSDTFHLPPEWSKYFIEDHEFYWASTSCRIRVWTKEYLLVDCPKKLLGPEIQVKEELRKYSIPIKLIPGAFENGPLNTIKDASIEGLNPALNNWLLMVMPFIRYFLRQGLRTEDESHFLFSPGRLFVTSTHVDLVMSMENISMPIRLAGLDQDPGWMPNFGRVIYFHFD